MNIEKMQRLTVEDGKSLTDAEVIAIYKKIEANIDDYHGIDTHFFIYLSERYLELSISNDRGRHEAKQIRRKTILYLISGVCMFAALYGSAKLFERLTTLTELERQEAQAAVNLRTDAIERKAQALDYLRNAADVGKGEFTNIQNFINIAGVDFGDSFIIKCQDYASGAARNATNMASGVTAETINALQRAINAQCELYNIDRQ